MIVFLYGPDSYRRASKEREIVEAYRKKHSSLSHAWFDLGEESGLENLREFLVNRSMFEPDKLAVVEGLNKAPAKELAELFKSYLENGERTTILVLSEGAPPPALAFLKEKPCRHQEFPLLAGRGLKSFIEAEAARRKMKLKSGMAEGLAQAFEGDSWAIVTELDKLALMREQVLEARPAPNYYELVNSLKYSIEPQLKLVALEFILSDRRDEARRVFNSLAYRLRNRAEAELLADYDVAAKSGKLGYEEILLDLALK
jgi:DNA polymerase III delta subunit